MEKKEIYNCLKYNLIFYSLFIFYTFINAQNVDKMSIRFRLHKIYSFDTILSQIPTSIALVIYQTHFRWIIKKVERGIKMIKLKTSNNIPLIAEVDLLVVGGGLAGLPAAKTFARLGKNVMLIEKGTFLGYEIGQWQRPWIRWDENKADLIREWFPVEDSQTSMKEGQIQPLHMDKLKLKLEDNLIDVGVKILYASIPTECKKIDNEWLVVIANKSGRQAIKAKSILDVTQQCVIAHISDRNSCTFVPTDEAYSIIDVPDKKIIRRTLEFTGIDNEFFGTNGGLDTSYKVPNALGVWGDTINIYLGAFSSDHVYVDIPMIVESKCINIQNYAQIEYGIRKNSLEVAAWLGRNLHPFVLAKIGMGSLEAMQADDFNAVALLKLGYDIGQKMADSSNYVEKCIIACHSQIFSSINFNVDNKNIINEANEAIEYKDNSEFNKLHNFIEIEANINDLEILSEADVLVVGGGTAGAVTSRTAAQEGVSTALVEMNTALGGTGTIGGVHYHWFGFRNAFTGEIDKRIKEWSEKLLYPCQKYYWGMNDSWSIEIKAFVLLEMCMEHNVQIFFDSITMGTLLDGDKVAGVAIATPYGPYALKGKVVVDATGDGDVAAFAGAELIYGNERDRMAMWCSFAQYKAPGQYKGGNFATTMDVGNIFDYTRFILVGRRRGSKDLHDHGTYVTPRESRHIKGEIVLNLTDQLLMRKYPDTISLCFSNHDPKGVSSADIVKFGLLPPHLQIEIPYRSMIPVKLEQLLVTGKALSSTHDALAAIRMQDDIQQQGGAAGLAAALCIKKGVSPRNLEVKELQERLIKIGLIPESVLDYKEDQSKPDYNYLIDALTGEEAFEWLEMSIHEKAEWVSPIVRLCAAKAEDVVPKILANYEKAEGNLKLLLARILLWHRNESGLDKIIAEIHRQMDEVQGLPMRKASVRWCQLYPDHGVMTEVTYLVNTLSRVQDKKSIAVLDLLADRITSSDRDYLDKKLCMFNYIESITYCSERLAYVELIPILEKLLALPEFQDCVRKTGIELDLLGERLSYLVICLSRAIARCGSSRGLLLLAGFVEDNRILLARSAKDELVELTGYDFGGDYKKWYDIITQMPKVIDTRPWLINID